MNNLLNFIKILSDENRLRIILLLNKMELCVCEMCEILQLSQPMVSRHLSKLRDSGIVKDERISQWVFYYLNVEDKAMKEIIEVIENNSHHYTVLINDEAALQQMVSDNKLCNINTRRVHHKK